MAQIGDLDLRRNLKMPPFVGFVLAPVFHDLQPRLNYAAMGRRGVTAMQYYQEFQNFPAAFGYGNAFSGRYAVRLCRSVANERRGPQGEEQRIERLILETRATLTGRAAMGAPASLGFEPELGGSATAGTGRVLHVLSRPNNPPGERSVQDIPEEISFLELHPFSGLYPTIPLLKALEEGYAAVDAATTVLNGIWGVANTDVYQHVHAREYLSAMENGITAALAAAGLPLESYAPLRTQVIFRRPSFIGERYALGVRVYRRDAEIVALGAFHNRGEDPFGNDGRAAVFLRFEGRLS